MSITRYLSFCGGNHRLPCSQGSTCSLCSSSFMIIWWFWKCTRTIQESMNFICIFLHFIFDFYLLLRLFILSLEVSKFVDLWWFKRKETKTKKEEEISQKNVYWKHALHVVYTIYLDVSYSHFASIIFISITSDHHWAPVALISMGRERERRRGRRERRGGRTGTGRWDARGREWEEKKKNSSMRLITVTWRASVV